MSRHLINPEQSASGTLLSSVQFVSYGSPDDVVSQRSPGRAYWCAGTAAAGQRILIHSGPSTVIDHAVEAIIDRATPWRSAATPNDVIGLIAAWRTTTTEAFDGACIAVSDSGVPQATDPVEDETLGLTNHIRVEVDDEIRLIEKRDVDGSPTTTTLWSMALSDATRVLALRLAVANGEVILWWNPEGLLDFTERPLVRVHTLLDGAGRLGIICGRDGRFTDLSMQYLVGAAAQPVQMKDVTDAGIELVPVRLRITGDSSRPSVMTSMQIEHADDTRMPERQERSSRVFLRDGRFMVRPGHTYRAFAQLRTCDGQMVFTRPVLFDVVGTPEDLLLRDCLGMTLAPEGGTSTVKVLVWPSSLMASGRIETVATPANIETSESMDVVLRGVQRSSLAPRRFSFDLQVNDELRKIYLDFRREAMARVRPFIWTHPLTGEYIVCYFASDATSIRGLEAEFQIARVELIEEPRCLGQDDTAPSAPGYSAQPAVPTVIPPGEGACCFEGNGCLTLTRISCEGAGGLYYGDGTRCDEVDCGSGPPGFNCEEDCGDTCDPAFEPEFCWWCPSTSGSSGAALCGCQYKQTGECHNVCDPGPPAQCSSGSAFFAEEYWCCYETGKELISSTTGGASIQQWCCTTIGRGCYEDFDPDTCLNVSHCCPAAGGGAGTIDQV